jgi:hypothetical protein
MNSKDENNDYLNYCQHSNYIGVQHLRIKKPIPFFEITHTN